MLTFKLPRWTRQTVSVTAALHVLIALVTAEQIWAIAGRTDDEYARRAAVAAEAAATFVDQSLTTVKLAIQALDGDPDLPGVVLVSEPAEIRRSLQRVAASLPMIQGFGLIDPQGRVYVAANAATAAPTDLSDRPYFVFHKENQTSDLRIDPPVVSRPDNRISIPVSMRANLGDGTFGGVVGVRIDPAFFARFFAKLGVAGVNLVDAEGALYARYPSVDLIAAEARPLAGFSGNGAFALTNKEGREFVGHSVPVSGSGLFVRATHFKTTIQADKLRRATVPLLVGVLSAIFLHVVAQKIRARTRAALEDAKQSRAVARSKSDFLANMGHELRTPLNAIIGFAEVIATDAMKLGAAPRYREYAADIRFSADHLLGVINRVLDMSKLEAGKWVLELGEMSTGSLIETTVQLARQRAERERVAIDTSEADMDVAFVGDERTLVQLLLNVTINAIKFAGEDRTVRLACRRLQNSIEFTVRDKGRGMTQADAERALRPFETAQDANARGRSDTGLGLPLSRVFAELHGGTLAIETAPGRGTCVRIVLPSRPPLANGRERAA